MPLALLSTLVLAGTLVGQAPSPQKQPNWATGAWKVEDAKFRRIRAELDDLKFGETRQPKRVKELYRLHVQPNLLLFRSRAKVAGPIEPDVFYWATALYAYYPIEGRELGYDVGYLLDTCTGPDSYEFARVAFCAYALEANYRPAQIALADRLLKRDPKDALVRTYFLESVKNVKKPTKELADKAIGIAEALYQEFPHRHEIYCPMRAEAYRFHFGATFTRASFERMVKYIDVVLAEPAVRPETKQEWKSQKAYFLRSKGKINFRG